MDKLEEKKVLRMAYKEAEYIIVDEIGEKPDFILKDSSGVAFGVEVTEHFNTESAARLLKVFPYIDKLLDETIPDEDKYMHKDDKKILKVDRIIINDENGNPKFDLPAIIQENPPREKYLDSISEVIKQKDEKSKKYRPNIHYTNLLIYDRANSLIIEELEDFYEVYYTPSIVSTLQNSLFKEITLISAHKEDIYYFNFKEILFLNRIFLFVHYYEESALKENKNIPILKVMIDLMYCLDKDGFKDVGVQIDKEKFEIYYGCSGFEVFKNKVLDITVNRYNFLKVPMHSNIPDFLQYVQTLPDESFYQGYLKFRTEKTFKCNCSIKCHQTSHL